MSTRQNLYSVDAAFNRLEYSGDHMSSKSDVDDDFTPTTPESDTTDSSDSREESERPSNAGMFTVYNIYY